MSESAILLATVSFWLFLAVVVATVAWTSIKKAQMRHETLLRLIESGQPLDEAVLHKYLAPASQQGQAVDPRQPYWTGGGVFFWGGFITVFAGIRQFYNFPVFIGLVILGSFAIYLAFRCWGQGEKEYREHKLLADKSNTAQ